MPTKWTAADIRKLCWRVKKPHSDIKLPEGFELWEEEHMLFILKSERVVDVLPAETVGPTDVNAAIESFVKKGA